MGALQFTGEVAWVTGSSKGSLSAMEDLMPPPEAWLILS
jgi:hypothetical protein